MAVQLDKVSVACVLNNGYSPSGTVKTLSVSLGSISKTSYVSSSALAIAGALAPCFDKSLLRIEETRKSLLSVDD